MRALLVPGIGGSGPSHWQTHWETDNFATDWVFTRLTPTSWDTPDAVDWLRALDDTSATAREVVIAHSLGCLAVAQWLTAGRKGVRGAVLVAPPDVDGPAFPPIARDFGWPAAPLAVPSLVIASDDDPYATSAVARRLATGWGSGFVSVGVGGHLNADSGIDGWPEGWRLVSAFSAGLTRPD